MFKEEKQDEQKEHDKITTEESVSYGTLDNDQDAAAKKDVSEECFLDNYLNRDTMKIFVL